MEQLSLNQRKALAEFCANFAVAWLAAGVIAPFVAGEYLLDIFSVIAMSVSWAGVSLAFMLFLTQGGKDELE